MFQFVAATVVAVVAAAPAVAISPGGVQAIGPKQDDPRALCDPGNGGIIGPDRALSIGPKQDDPRKLAIGPKQDDPRKAIQLPGGKQAGYDPETDPQAHGGAEMIGPKQDDPRQGLISPVTKLAIGPKQDDPRSPGQVAVGAYNPETDPQAMANATCKKQKD